MSVQQNQDDEVSTIDDKAVAEYLAAHSGFFNDRDELLANMVVTHTTGASVSLIERQVVILREQNGGYQQQLAELVDVARVNDVLMVKLQKLVLALLETNELEALLMLIQQSLKDDFNADGVALCLFADPASLSLESDLIGDLQVRFVSREDKQFKKLGDLTKGAEPACGVLTDAELACLFDDAPASGIRSVAQLPLMMDGHGASAGVSLGVLAIGSKDAGRFCAGVGTVFLKYLGALITRKLRPHLSVGEDV
ncbi:MAG: DUF484 family protein [Thiotrichaceae bacterium]|nr:DUF484 family protein [Thiotrichaceae bacterium]